MAAFLGLVVAPAGLAERAAYEGEYTHVRQRTQPLRRFSRSPRPKPAIAPFTGQDPEALARARVTLRVAPKYTSGQRNFRFSGRLLGGHIPRGGKKLVLQARQGRGSWREFSVIRTGPDGRFHASYALQFLGPGRWQVRVLCKGEGGYPFATGTSNAVGVRVLQ